MDTVISTIGYEGASIDVFLETLTALRITLLIDVRDCPVSRKRGFSKKPLAECLRAAGIDYVHLVGLGDPKPGRDAASAGRMEEFRRIFFAHMQEEAAQRDLRQAEVLINQTGHACIMCYERDPDLCHRSLVAKMLLERKPLQIKHRGIREALTHARNIRQRAGVDTGQSLAAC
ncbi:MAG: DUF488 domain-containing protein [Magnetococcales bacterium]|nr:DUF488 domain-containing protein [Magnetococcales bacterium]MBF0114716.1 DUF488 domain-containing protein [Magnetococcales bacterium]